MTLSFCFVIGWTEGYWQTKKFRKLLTEAGFEAISNAVEADILITHSLGCFLIPKNFDAKIVLLINPPYWPHRTGIYSVAEHFVAGFKMAKGQGAVSWWLNKILHNNWYFISKPKLTYYALTQRQLSNLPAKTKARRIILIRNKGDSFCHPDIQKLLPKTKEYRFVQFDGDHEDCWLNPQPYVDLIQKELE
jgi:hypothetical protein